MPRYIVTWSHPSGAGRGAYVELSAPDPRTAARMARPLFVGRSWGGVLNVREVGDPEGFGERYRVEPKRLRRLQPA